MRILVTGAQGYIGYGVVRQLLKDGCNVIATDIQEQKFNYEAEYMRSDIFEIADPYNYFHQPDILLHLAWRDGFQHNSTTHIDDLHKHYHFIEKVVAAGIRQICILGSVHEIGFYEGSVREDTPTNPQSLYGVSKNALREAVRILAQDKNIKFQWIRGYYIVGNTQMGCSVFSKITQAEELNQLEFPFTEGKNQFDFIDYDKFCEQVAAVVQQDDITGVINCCSGYPQKIGDRVEQFLNDNHYKIKLKYNAFPNRSYDSKAIWGDDSKIYSILHRRKGDSV